MIYLNYIYFFFQIFFQIFDASTNTWKVMDERTQTDVTEKIIELPPKIVYIDDIVDVTNIKHINDHTTNLTDISNVTNIKNVTNIIDERTNITNIHNIEDIKNVVSRKFLIVFFIFTRDTFLFLAHMYVF